MLRLKNISKNYMAGNTTVQALKHVSVDFRPSEFVSILGPSGCGKTTLLNIVGGLDRYSEGDLFINYRSTKQFADSDWDTYRNHSIGFVFQNYNLIPHQSVLANVELALTLSGQAKEKRRRAKEILHKVGLGDQMDKKPNQMSGGQMQRVAIARALVNDPDIILADEPTGALDSSTSVQIMELLKEISKDKLVIMVTHNDQLAEQYSTRIIRLLDGEIKSDTDPYTAPEQAPEVPPKKKKKTSMGMLTALTLSLNNLMTKKTRTLLTSFAGSIGIIGIALILSISQGIQSYIDKVEEDTLSSYPITLEQTAVDVGSVISSMMGDNVSKTEHEEGKIYSNNIMTDMMQSMMGGYTDNNLEAFKTFLEKDDTGIRELSSDIQYSYKTVMNIYKADTTDGLYRVNPDEVFSSMGFEQQRTNTLTGTEVGMSMSPASGFTVWNEMLDNDALLSSQYDVLAGRMAKAYDELVLIVNDQNEISDYTLYALGLKDNEELTDMVKDYMAGGELKKAEQTVYTYDDLLDLRFKLLVNTDYFEKNENGTWTDKTEDDIYVISKLDNAIELKIVGILRPAEDANVSSSTGMIGYRADLMTTLIGKVNDSEIVKAQKENVDTDVFTGMRFVTEDEEYTMKDIEVYIATLPAEQQAQYQGYMQSLKAAGKTDAEIVEIFQKNMKNGTENATYDGNLSAMGVADLAKPSAIHIYPKDFEAKEVISDKINEYNNSVDEVDQITYTDYIGLMLSSISTIINAISYVLIAFVAISLIVSSIMIGIITYISVLERTKEIGILRSIGASKKDISRVFNAETMIVGLVAGLLGIGITLLLIIPVNAVLHVLTQTTASAVLPWQAGVILVAISMLLTMIAGLIPSRIAAKKDPVIALRTE